MSSISTEQKEKDPLATFFRVDSSEAKELFEKNKPESSPIFIGGADEEPTMPNIQIAETVELKAWWRNLRAFFRSGKGGGLSSKKQSSLLPALIAGYHDDIPFADYPLWVADETSLTGDVSGNKCASLGDLLQDSIDKLENESSRELLSRFINNILQNTIVRLNNEPKPLNLVIPKVLDEFQENLGLKEKEAETLKTSIKEVKGSLPSSGILIPFTPEVPFQLLSSALTIQKIEKTGKLLERIHQAKGKLKDVLSVELENRPEATKVQHLESSYDFAASLLDITQLSKVLPSAKSELMSTDRFKRIQKIIPTLDNAEKLLSSKATLLIEQDLYDLKSINWDNLFEGCLVKSISGNKGCEEALSLFEESMEKVSQLFAALQMAELEAKELYDPAVHADHYSSFTWRDLSEEEMECVSKTVLVSTYHNLVNNEFGAFSHLLSFNAPIKIIAINDGESRTHMQNGSETDVTLKFEQELAAFASTHRNTFALQATASTPVELFQGFNEGLCSLSPALFHVFQPKSKNSSLAISVSAAVEGRKFPGFTYNADVNIKWGSRFNATNNPQPTKDWPEHSLSLNGDESLKVQFTFADFAATEKKYQEHFLVVPPEYWNEDLVPVADYLNLTNVENYGKVPFIWMVDGNNSLQKVATTLPLMLLCKERLDFWRSLQESSGINSFHVEQALEIKKRSLQESTDEQIELLKSTHAKELEDAKEQSTAEAMEQLTAVLLDLDTSSLVASVPSASLASEPKTPTTSEGPLETMEEDAAPAEEEEEADSLPTQEAWIETPLCTSCNECTDLNDKLFNYNNDKMAYVADPKAGTFSELVSAAELCPVGIIHPGAPLNPDEADLEDLVKRAEKYN